MKLTALTYKHLAVIILAFVIFLLITTSCTKNKNDINNTTNNTTESLKYQKEFDLLNDFSNHNPDSAEVLAYQLEEKLIHSNNTVDLIRLYGFLSEFYQYRKKDDFKALLNISKAIELYILEPTTSIESYYLFINAGNILLNYGMNKQAINIYRQTKTFVNSKVYTLLDNNIGLAFQEMGNCDSALYYFRLAQSEIDFSGITTILKQIQSNNYKISASLDCNYTDSIPFYFNENKRKFEIIDNYFSNKSSVKKKQIWEEIKIEYYTNKVRTYNAVGSYYSLLEQEDNAKEVYVEAVKFAKLSHNSSWIVSVYEGWAGVAYQLQSYKESLIILDSAISTALTTKDFKTLERLYSKKYETYLKVNDINSAQAYKKISNSYKDSLSQIIVSDENISKRIELAINPINLALKNYVLRKAEVSKNFKTDTKLKEQKVYIYRYKLAFFITILIAILAIIMMFFYRTKTKKKTAEISMLASQKDNKLNDKDLQNLSTFIQQKNDSLYEIQDDLKEILKYASDENKPQIKELSIKISQSLFSNYTANFSGAKLKNIEKSFFVKLTEKFPELSEKEKQMCALIKLNLSSQEIALIINETERSVITALYRLRRKFMIESDDKLTKFLNQL